jgi:hypothetical protein
MPFRLFLPAAAVAAICLAALLAGWSVAPGQTELRWSPLTVGLTLVVAVGLAEGVRRFCRWPTARALTTIATSTAGVMVLLSVRLGYFTPAAERPVESWHLWPLSTAVNLVAVTLGLLALAGTSELGWRIWTRQARAGAR